MPFSRWNGLAGDGFSPPAAGDCLRKTLCLPLQTRLFDEEVAYRARCLVSLKGRQQVATLPAEDVSGDSP